MRDFHEQKLKSINKDLTIIERFNGGMSNFTYLCINEATKEKFVFRVPGDGSEIFVNFESELYNLEQVKDLDITSQVIYIDEHGYKLAKYIEGEIPKENVNLNKVSDLLKKLHSSDASFKEKYQHLERLSKYESIRKTKLSDEYQNLRDTFIQIYNDELQMHVKYPCHSDAQIANIIRSSNELYGIDNYYLIDFEFAATNDIIYDIASFGNINFSDAEALIEVYFDNPSKDKYKRLYSWRMFQALQWHNVAMYKHEIGLGAKLGLDFEQIAYKYVILAQEMHNKYHNVY